MKRAGVASRAARWACLGLFGALWLHAQACFYDEAPLKARACSQDADCGEFEGYVCQRGYCQEAQAQCAQDADCELLLTDLRACERAACEAGRCERANREAGASCGEPGSCAVGACDAAGTCQTRLDDATCDDGLFCDGPERCAPQEPSADARGCVEGAAPNLEDGVACTQGRCDEDADRVTQDCAACECCGDALACGGRAPTCFDWVCSAQFSCELAPQRAGTPCDDGVACTQGDACDPQLKCAGLPSDAACDDGAYCNGPEACAPGELGSDANGCASRPAPLDDGINCTIDACDEELDLITHEGASCACASDADCVATCRVGTCVNSECQFAPAELGSACDDGVRCTTGDRCDAEQRCVGTPDHLSCDDGLFCTGAERCAPGGLGTDLNGCARTPVGLDDGVVCTVDACDEATNRVTHDDADCACDTDADCAATCQQGRCVEGACRYSALPIGDPCDDGVACTVGDACDADQRCVGRPDDARCDDGLFCDGAERCDPAQAQDPSGCAPGRAPDLRDEYACTVDACDEANDRATHDPAQCQCQRDEQCQAECMVGRCVEFACVFEPVEVGGACDDGVACTQGDACGEQGQCAGRPSDALCDDGLFCVVGERCEPAQAQGPSGCVPGRPLDAAALDDGVDCTVDACDEQAGAIVHRAEDCGCERDEDCASLGPCEVGTCDLDTFTCRFAPKLEGAECDDGIACTGDGACNAQRVCVPGAPLAGFCEDGGLCNGEEVCAPLDPEADAQGCAPGVGLVEGYEDPRACVMVSCTEEGGLLVDDSACCGPSPEGALGSPACGDGRDNDCDGQADGDDVDCVPGPEGLGGIALWLDAAYGPAWVTGQESQAHNLQGSQWWLGGSLQSSRSEAAAPRAGSYYVYPVGMYGAYPRPPSVRLDDSTVGNYFGDRFEVEVRNTTETAFELYVYRTDSEGAGFGKGPDEISWRVSDFSLLSRLEDRSAANRDAAQGDPARQPVLVPGAQNGLPMLRFVNDWMEFSRPVGDQFSIFVVFRTTDTRGESSAGAWWDCPAILGGERAGNYRDMGLVMNQGKIAWGAQDAGYDAQTSESYADGRAHMVALTRSRAPASVILRVDGAQRATGAGVNQVLDETATLNLARHPTGSGAMNLDYGEVLVFDRVLSAPELALVETYLNAKWGLTPR